MPVALGFGVEVFSFGEVGVVVGGIGEIGENADDD